jgi:uncharacterized protein YecE (DUF72 family)
VAEAIKRVEVGTSGFSYAHWRHGVFYPEGLAVRNELAYYASHFPTVELNNPFYRLPSREQFARWRRQTPPAFTFAVKASRFITHRKKLLDPEPPLALLRDRLAGLAPKLGPVLFQLPSNFQLNLERLRHFLAALGGLKRPVMEFRHASWFVPEVYRELERYNVTLGWAVSPQQPEPPRVLTSNRIYLRLHGGQGRDGNFTRSELAKWARRLAAAPAAEVWVYFNNDWQGFAIRNAATMIAFAGPTRR